MDSGQVPWRRPPLVASAWELRCFGRAWIVIAVVGAAADVAAGGAADLDSLEIWGCALVFFLTVAGALARAFLGLRTQPDMQYAQIFDRSPPPPRRMEIEASRSTATRATWAAIGVAALTAVGAAAILVVVFVLEGRPRDHVLDHLAGAAGLVAAGWMLMFGAAALRIAQWFRAWEERRGGVVRCRPLLSGRLAYVYYVEPPGAGPGG